MKLHVLDPTRDASRLIVGENGANNRFSKARRQITNGTGAIVCQLAGAINQTPVNTPGKTEMGGMFDPIDAQLFRQ